MNDNSMIVIDKKRYSESNLRMLLGIGEDITLKDHIKKISISEDILNLAWVLDDPSRLTVMLEKIHAIPHEDNILVRLALARVQIDAALSMNENLEKYTKQKFVAETIERMVFGDLLVEGKSSKNNGNGKEKTIVTRKKTAPPSKPSVSRKKTSVRK